MALMAAAPAADFVSKRKKFDEPGLYLLIKLIAYCLWCYLGLRLFRPQETKFLGGALRFGIVRLFLGLFFGLVIFFLAAFWGHTLGTGLPQNVLTYLGAYVPVRWIEWTIMAALLSPGLLGAPHGFIGNSNRDRLCRLGGIVISCVADIPFIAAFDGPIPTGRFLC
jgi:hypothetical protein